MYISACSHTHARTHAHTYTRTHMYTIHTNACMHTCMNTQHRYTHMCTHTCIHATHMQHRYRHTHAHIHTLMYLLVHKFGKAGESLMVNLMCDSNLLYCNCYFVAGLFYFPTFPQSLLYNYKVSINFAHLNFFHGNLYDFSYCENFPL